MIPVSWLHRAGQLQRGRAARAFLRGADRPRVVQAQRLHEILTHNRDTVYGRQHDFASVRSPDDYRRLPLSTPTSHQAWITRGFAGEAGVLTAEKPVYYVKTTGSTGPPKYIPITPRYREEFQRALHASMWHLCRRYPRAYSGRVLYFVGSASEGVAPNGATVGTMSGFTFNTLPRVVRAMYAWPQELFTIRDLRTRTLLALQLAIQGAPTLCGTIFPISLVLLFRSLAENADLLAFHLERGTLPDGLQLTEDQRRFYQGRVQKRPDRAAGLRQGQKGDLVRHAFPELAMVLCWTGATAGLYVPELQRWVGEDVLVRDAVYSASEGWMNVPMGDDTPGGPVSVTGHYQEFIPEADYLAGSTDTLGVHELDDGARYAVVLTTSGGLYRYALGDIVEVCGRFRALPCIRFVRKVGAACNLAGEKLDETHVNHAVAAALQALGAEASWFCVAPQQGAVPSYRLYIEPCTKLPGAEALAAQVDRALGDVAWDYRAHRQDASLGPLSVQEVPIGTFSRWRAGQAAAGVAVAQMKARHLVDDVAAIPAPMRASP